MNARFVVTPYTRTSSSISCIRLTASLRVSACTMIFASIGSKKLVTSTPLRIHVSTRTSSGQMTSSILPVAGRNPLPQSSA